MHLSDERIQRRITSIALPVNLIRQPIAYLESHSAPMATIFTDNYKYYLEILIQEFNRQKVTSSYLGGLKIQASVSVKRVNVFRLFLIICCYRLPAWLIAFLRLS